SPVAVPPKPSWSGAMTRRPVLRAGMTGRQLASPVTPGPDPCSRTRGGAAGPGPDGSPVSITAVRTPATSAYDAASSVVVIGCGLRQARVTFVTVVTAGSGGLAELRTGPGRPGWVRPGPRRGADAGT